MDGSRFVEMLASAPEGRARRPSLHKNTSTYQIAFIAMNNRGADNFWIH